MPLKYNRKSTAHNMTTTKLPLVGWLKFLNWIELLHRSEHHRWGHRIFNGTYMLHVKKKKEASLPLVFVNAVCVLSTVKHCFYICLTIIIQNLSKCYILPFIWLNRATTKTRLVVQLLPLCVCVCVWVCVRLSVYSDLMTFILLLLHTCT